MTTRFKNAIDALVMEASIELYEPIHDHLKTVDRRGNSKRFKWVARFGPVAKICPSEKTALNYLYKMGFRYKEDGRLWLSVKSEDEIELERNYSYVTG